MDIMSIHVCVHFGLRSSDKCLLKVNVVLYRILHSKSKKRVGGKGNVTLQCTYLEDQEMQY